MEKNAMSRTVRYMFCVLLIVLALTVSVPRAKATSTAIGSFYGGCNSFSVDVAVTGSQDNGGGMDRFRFTVTDGSNNVLYTEDASVKVGTTVGSQAVNLLYTRFASTNPIRFAVVELDNAGNAAGE